MKIHSKGAELFHAEGRTDRHDEANSRFSQFRRRTYKMSTVTDTAHCNSKRAQWDSCAHQK